MKTRTALIIIVSFVGLIILGQVTKTDPPVRTPTQVTADTEYQKKQNFKKWCTDNKEMCQEGQNNLDKSRRRALGEIND